MNRIISALVLIPILLFVFLMIVASIVSSWRALKALRR